MSLRQPSAAIFSIVAGGYIALLVQGVASHVLESGYTAQWPVTIGVCIGLLVAVRCYTWTAPATVLVRTRLYLLPVAVIFVPIFAVPFLALLGHRGYETWVSGWGIELVVLSLAGMIFYLITVNRHVASLHERESILAEWTASPDTWYRRLIRGAGFGIGCGCFVGGILLTHSVDLAMNPLPAFGGAVIGQAITSGRTRTYTLFESGLCIRRSKTFNYQFVPRGQLRSVELTDDRLAIRRGLPWPLPIRCATRTMARPKRVTDALAQLVEPTPSVQ